MRRERSLSGRRRAWALLALGAIAGFGCSEAATGRAPSGEPIVQLDPPKSDDGSATAPGCDGVTESGTCEGTAAVYCDVDRGSLSRSDCAAIGKSCVIDSRRGATCAEVPDSIPPSGACEDGIGYWDEGGSLTRWDCEAEGMSCEIDGCASGAYCCGGEDSGDDRPPADDPGCCDREDPDCTNPCTDTGGDDEPRPEPPEDVDCEEIGYEGICPDAQTLLYCVGDSPVTQGCHGGDVCRVDGCSPGIADCCPTDGGDDAAVCAELGFEGECDGDTLRYCSGDTLHEQTCGGGCNPDCGPGVGACCDAQPTYDCDDVNGALGICDGNTLYYCLNDEITEQDCGTQSCEVDTCFENGADCC